jgi:hypothetical protein
MRRVMRREVAGSICAAIHKLQADIPDNYQLKHNKKADVQA